MDTFDTLAAELAALTRRLDEARTAARPPNDGTRDERADDLRALRNFAALVQFGVPRHLTVSRRVRRPMPARAHPSGIPYPRRPTDAT